MMIKWAHILSEDLSESFSPEPKPRRAQVPDLPQPGVRLPKRCSFQLEPEKSAIQIFKELPASVQYFSGLRNFFIQIHMLRQRGSLYPDNLFKKRFFEFITGAGGEIPNISFAAIFVMDDTPLVNKCIFSNLCL